MRLEDNFYIVRSVVLTNQGAFTGEVELLPQHPIYEGHFPQQAVVPGVCTLTIIKECLGKALQREVRFSAIKECKYLSALLPFDGLTLKLDFQLVESQLRGVVVRVNDNQTVLKLKATIR